MRRIWIMAALCLLAAAVALAGGAGEAGKAPKAAPAKLTVALNFPATDVTFKNIQTIAAEFVKGNPGTEVEVVNPPDYENTMKTKMAANDLPDVFTTHGWSVMRYSEYLRALNDRPWFGKINPSIKPVVTDAAGKVYVLPMDVDMAGIAFNAGVLDEAGVDPFALKSWDDFMAACAKVKAAGKIAVAIGGSAGDDRWTVGNFFDWVAPSFLIADDKQNYRAALMDGSFDWANWVPVAQLLVTFRDKGYLNPDYTQGTWQDVGKLIAAGKAAFGLFGNYLIGEAKKYNPEGRYGFMPVPAAHAGDTPTLITGERTAIGLWKDGRAMAASLKLLDYLAEPANVNLVAKGNAIPTGLVGTGYKTDAGDLTPYFDKVGGYRTFPYFDRVYLPSGMWDTMCYTGTGLLASTMTPAQAADKMKADYLSLMKK
jgi:raffinose/stachyose/melibiose transport system substrate-binding protein